MRVFDIGPSGAVALALCCGPAAAGQGGYGAHVDWALLKPPDFAADYARGYEQGRRLAAQRAGQARAASDRLEPDPGAARDRILSAARAKQAGGLVAAGHCDEARTYALGEGDFDLATRVAEFCRRQVK